MKNKTSLHELYGHTIHHQDRTGMDNVIKKEPVSDHYKYHRNTSELNEAPEILFLTSYPPRECGIATYSQDLIKALNNKFSNTFSLKVCALESGETGYIYPEEVSHVLKTSVAREYEKLAGDINGNNRIKIVVIQHEFGFYKENEQAFRDFLYDLMKPVVIVFHTVLPHPDEKLRAMVTDIAGACLSVIVMTNTSARILADDYRLEPSKISVIPHGTHLVPHLSEKFLKAKYGLLGRKVLTTFGLLSSGKSIETTLDAMPAIVKQTPEVVFLVIGKTHPEVKKNEGEVYREMLERRVEKYSLQNNVIFINQYLALPELLEYLQLTDIYLFTTNDPNQAVSGTFAYAMSTGCPIISTPIPHARELLTEDTGIIFDFCNPKQLSDGVNKLLSDSRLRRSISSNTLQKIVSTAWENSGIAHARLFERISGDKIQVRYNLPAISLSHMERMTTDTGIIQFSRINQPDICSGYTLDDNARALVTMCMYYDKTGDKKSFPVISKYLDFIKYCQQSSGEFQNYVDKDLRFTGQNKTTNLDDSNGRALWALGYVISFMDKLPGEIISEAKMLFCKALPQMEKIHSTRAMAFMIKGLYYYHQKISVPGNLTLLKVFADRLVQMYRHESTADWDWFEGYLTYANSILPEAMLYAWLVTGDAVYKDIAISTLKFLLSQIFNENGIEVISNKKWLQKGQEQGRFGEQPIDVAYTVMTLNKFYEVLADDEYHRKMETAFSWFSGNNRLHQIIYNPCTGGCYDGLEETHVNLNQGAESTVSYLMARLTVEKDKPV
jgi:glycosyltransferase involved in cell wall biosynthesis